MPEARCNVGQHHGWPDFEAVEEGRGWRPGSSAAEMHTRFRFQFTNPPGAPANARSSARRRIATPVNHIGASPCPRSGARSGTSHAYDRSRFPLRGHALARGTKHRPLGTCPGPPGTPCPAPGNEYHVLRAKFCVLRTRLRTSSPTSRAEMSVHRGGELQLHDHGFVSGSCGTVAESSALGATVSRPRIKRGVWP